MKKRRSGNLAARVAGLDLLVEIGTEEIPASYIEPALAHLRSAAEAFSPAGRIGTWGTPRRLVLFASGVARFRDTVVWGPPLVRARDEKGNWNKSALGFARSRGAGPSDLKVGTKNGGEYLKLDVCRDMGREIAAALPQILETISFPKSMRWLPGDRFRFARPIRWLVCLFGEEPLEFEAAGVRSRPFTRGHRFFAPGPWKLDSADPARYRKLLREKYVIVDQEARRRMIEDGLRRRRKKSGGRAPLPGPDRELLREVVQLVEYPRLIEGKFDRRFLKLPEEVIETVMKSHQRYFPVRDHSGRLAPRFLVVANGPFRASVPIREGNERVLRARLSDAEFFWREDLTVPLEARREELAGVVFHARLGNYLEKVGRLERLAPAVGRGLGLAAGELACLRRAAFLSKSDLTTAMVAEFTELQGVMGREYALRAGEKEEVARALYEQYLPRGAGDDLPASGEGIALALADRLDTLAGFSRAGLKPSGSVDPYGLRRQALGIVRIVLGRSLTLPLESLVARAVAAVSPPSGRGRLRREVMDFILARMKGHLESEGLKTHVLGAAFSVPGGDLLDLAVRARVLQKMEGGKVLRAATTVVERTHNIVRGRKLPARLEIREELFRQAEERELYSVFRAVVPEFTRLLSEGSYRRAIELYARAFSRPLHAFFAGVMVNVADAAVRRNRLFLLASINRLFSERLADLALLQFDRGEHLL